MQNRYLLTPIFPQTIFLSRKLVPSMMGDDYSVSITVLDSDLTALKWEKSDWFQFPGYYVKEGIITTKPGSTHINNLIIRLDGKFLSVQPKLLHLAYAF